MLSKVNWSVKGWVDSDSASEPDFVREVQYVPDVARAVSDACGAGCAVVIVTRVAQLNLGLQEKTVPWAL